MVSCGVLAMEKNFNDTCILYYTVLFLELIINKQIRFKLNRMIISVRSPSSGPNNLNVYEPQQKPGRGFCAG